MTTASFERVLGARLHGGSYAMDPPPFVVEWRAVIAKRLAEHRVERLWSLSAFAILIWMIAIAFKGLT